MAKRQSAQDYKETAAQSERKYSEGSKNRWYNKEHRGKLWPYAFLAISGFSTLIAGFYCVASSLSSLSPEIEIVRGVTVLKKERDPRIPAFVVYAAKEDGTEINLRNKNSVLEKKINELEIFEKLIVGRKYDLKIAHRKQYPLNVYGNILEATENKAAK